MAGLKGHSGRKPHLEDKTKYEILRLSAATIFHAFRAPNSIFSFERKVDLARDFVLKTIPTKIESDGSFAPIMIQLLRNEQAMLEESPKQIAS